MPRRIKSQLGKTALLLGAGYSAKAMINPLRARGYDVIATTRMPQKAEALRKMGVTPLLYDGDITAPLKECLANVFRLAGIYGPGRNGFERLRQGKARAVIKAGHVVNRIHVEDIVSAVLASIDRPHPLKIYNLADGHPAPPQEVLNFAADLIDVARPVQLDHDTADITDMARSFYKETKRIASRHYDVIGLEA